jgi:shikimate kinase
LDGPVAIVGYMGSGKSTVGRLLARELGWGYVDLDRTIAREAGRAIPEIFAERGEEYFRDLESRALLEALDGPSGRVVACGGGVVSRAENRERLRETVTVFLRERVGTMYARTRGAGRPLRAASMKEFRRRYEERLPRYLEVADLVVDVGGRRPKSVAREIELWLGA